MLSELTDIVISVGEQLLKWRKSGLMGGHWEGSQFKAEADSLANEKLTARLAALAPGIPVISEERQESWVDERPERYWLIDPIDGTASFAHGYPGFVTQVALMVGHRPSLAAIFAPAIDCLYTAEQGKGAFLNGSKLMRSKTMPNALIDNYPEPRGIALQAYMDFDFTHYIECGSISLKICKVADGTAGLFIKDVPVRDWDLAAPQLVLEESDGFLTDIHGHTIEYANGYEKTGLVAACHLGRIEQIVNWYVDIDLKKMFYNCQCKYTQSQ